MTELEVAAILGAEGPFAREVPGFAPREAQQRMAAAVATAIGERDMLIAEAGTGTGKTFAYLVPALMSGRKVIVSTGTKALQDQLFFRDLPRVHAVLGSRARLSLLKGRANYLCLYRLDQAVREGNPDRQLVSQLSAIRAWSARTRRGDRMEMVDIPEDSPVWPRVTSTPENCLGSECRFFDECHVVKARREAMEADVVVVNHHLLMADLALKQEGFGEILPGADAFILDEAHQIPELAGQFFSQSVSSRQIVDLGQDALAEAQGVTGATSQLLEPVEAIQDLVRRLRLAMDPLPARGPLGALDRDPTVRETLVELRDVMAAMSDLLAALGERSRGLANAYERAQMLSLRLDRIAEEHAASDVRWYETWPRGFALHATPLDLASPLRAMRMSTDAAWIHTSATLSIAGDFGHFARQLGLEDPHTLHVESPFDYQRQALAYLPANLPDPSARDYTDRVIAAVRPVLDASDGRAFLLFTSHRALRRAAELLEGRVPWPLFVQGTAPRHRLLEEFRASGRGVLLGAASFWEGVDVAGEALSVVVIDKLPFAMPDDPVLQARLEALEESGINPFMGWQVPTAVIALKQGAGRLIRDVHDRGVLVLCDPRLGTKGYGRLFLASLPPMPRTRELVDVQAFFAANAPEASP
ncbi:ATP-dependent DNA helicase DinG [Luteibacter sp. UNCMF331Sha3.1]|uniref:ATP-dependent DNA helicase n=1 Tax=Luteibacter sp. UNCMF331Sha3.1 TaxID=1502760 RepID=UPI0008B8D575|nr:ATP-dependent DNA helicase [Luteibacter sp. UNCMF331Sha3.1]SEM30428.1 ATP-dependent DNA helicase DinG [Luteibacter sp. UNCMF331Sha3.1]